MEYKFHTYKERDFRIPDKFNIRPVVEITDLTFKYGECFAAEINNLSSNINYLNEIVFNFECVLKGESDLDEGFGYEVYMIECDKEKCRVLDVTEGWSQESEINTIEVYELMRDWRDYVANWEKENKNSNKFSP